MSQFLRRREIAVIAATDTTAGDVNVVDRDGDGLRYYLLYPPSYQPYQDGFQVVVTDGNYVTTTTVPVQTFVDPYMFSW